MAELSGRPLRDTRRDRALFVNRAETIRAAERTLRNHGNVLLVGERGSGKSSLLRMLGHRLEEGGLRPVTVDGRAAATTVDFLALLRDQFQAWPQLQLGQTAGALDSAVPKTVDSPQLTLGPTATETQSLLSE